MARLLGTAPSNAQDAATKSYVDTTTAPLAVASGASAVRFTGVGTTLPTSGQQTDDIFFLSADSTELNYSENTTGTITAISGNNTYTQIPNTSITVFPNANPVWIEYAGSVKITTAGGGSIYLALADITGTFTVVDSAYCGVVPTESGTNSEYAGFLHGMRRIGTVSASRTFALYGVNLLDTSSSLASEFVNSSTNPSWIAAIRR